MERLSTSIQKLLDFFLYYFFLIDIYLLSFFCKKIPYLFFIFCYFFGTFGYSESLSDLQFICKFFCLVFSWYLGVSSLIVFCAFNTPITKDYLNNLLGREFVVSKIGNPGSEAAIKFGAFILGGAVANETGKYVNGKQIAEIANTTLEHKLTMIHVTPDLTPKEKGRAVQDALKLHTAMSQVKPEGTFDRMMQLEAQKDMVARFTGMFSGKK